MTEDTNYAQVLHPSEYEKASNGYLMAVVAVIAGLPLPIINVIASLLYYLGQRKSSYFVRWHCIQAILAQTVMVPFNSFAVAWTISLFINEETPNMYFIMYVLFVLVFNIVEFFTVIITASQVGKGKNVRWFLIANITDALTSKENRDPYRL